MKGSCQSPRKPIVAYPPLEVPPTADPSLSTDLHGLELSQLARHVYSEDLVRVPVEHPGKRRAPPRTALDLARPGKDRVRLGQIKLSSESSTLGDLPRPEQLQGHADRPGAAEVARERSRGR